MSLLGKVKQGLKDATGIGLSADEQYKRAYEKGVFIQDYKAAVENFSRAAEKFAEPKSANPIMAQRARANAAVYALLADKGRSRLAEVIGALESVPEIEQIGSDKETTRTAPWVTELKALELEFVGESAQSSGDKKTAYAQASDLLMGLGTGPLVFADKIDAPGPKDRALLRACYDGALSDYHAALTEVLVSPPNAHDYLQKAAVRFRQANAPDWSGKVDNYIEQVKAKRHCWMCGREMQGRNIFYEYYPAKTEEYNRRMVQTAGEDSAMLDTEGSVTLCTVCGSAVERQADTYATKRANEVREWAAPILRSLGDALENHNQRLNRLESVAHHH